MWNWIKKNPVMLVVIAILVGIILTATAARSRAELKVRVETPLRQDILSLVSTNGKVEPVDNFEAHAPAPGTVEKIYVREGEKVRAGQLLVKLDDTTARSGVARASATLRAAEVELNALRRGGTHEELLTTETALVKAEAEASAARRNLEAVRRLRERGAASEGELQEAENRVKRAEADLRLLQQKQSGRYSNPEIERAQANVDQARAALEAAQALLRELNIRAPRAGTVYSLPVREGAFVGPGDLIVQVADLSKVYVRAFVDEPEIGKLDFGQKAEITWDALPSRNWEGVVTNIPATVVSRGTRTVGEVVITVNNDERKLLPNVNVNVAIITAKANDALTVAREAVFQDDGQRFVFIIDQGELRRKPVETGISNLTRIQVTNGLDPQSVIAVTTVNAQPLVEGAAVQVVQR